MPLLFKRTRILERQIDEFLNSISQASIVYKNGLANYLEGDLPKFEEKLANIHKLENNADKLRREAENILYTHSLIPEHRGDVLGLLENMDDIIDLIQEALATFSVEKPDISEEYHQDLLEIAEYSTSAVESMVLAAKAFFTDVNAVKNHLHKVYFYEKESDKVSIALKRKIFDSEADLSLKIHLRDFTTYVDSIADIAESAADRLAIYTIKRTV